MRLKKNNLNAGSSLFAWQNAYLGSVYGLFSEIENKQTELSSHDTNHLSVPFSVATIRMSLLKQENNPSDALELLKYMYIG